MQSTGFHSGRGSFHSGRGISFGSFPRPYVSSVSSASTHFPFDLFPFLTEYIYLSIMCLYPTGVHLLAFTPFSKQGKVGSILSLPPFPSCVSQQSFFNDIYIYHSQQQLRPIHRLNFCQRCFKNSTLSS